KYRLHTRRPSPSNNESANSQSTAPFVLVGNIFVQQQEYGGVASSTTSGEMTKVVAPSGIYAPVATHPPPAATIKKPEFKKFEHSISEDRANNNSEGAVHSNSPTSSSSTHNTTNTSLGY
ncbi:myb-like transcription factor family protein, partial [Trifolium medium]|nr:myb-like transcription factor family protein [Trifolium medium]